MRAASYLRVSLDRTAEELAITRQREDVAALVAARKFDHVAEFAENDTSAAGTKARPQFDAMLAAVTDGSVDVVIAWSLDRLCRTARDRLRLIEACRDNTVMICLVRGSDMDPTTPAGRLTLDVLGSVAQHEIDQKADRQRRATEQAAHAGRPPIGPAPFGYASDRRTRHPEQAPAVRKAYSDFLTGATLAGIAREWNERGLFTGRVRRGRIRTGERSEWVAESVRRVLLRPTNAGLREFRGEIIGKADVEPIVDEDVFMAVRDALNDPARRHKRPTPRNLLSGVARCGACGEHVVSGSRRPAYHVYRCEATNAHVARRGDHADAWIAGGSIEGEEVAALVVRRLSRPDAVELLEPVDTGPDPHALRDEVTALRARLDSVAVEFATDDTVTPAQLRSITSTLRARLGEKEAQLAVAGQRSTLAPLVTADDVAGAWSRLHVEQRRHVIDRLMTVTLHPVGRGARRFDPNSLEVAWKP